MQELDGVLDGDDVMRAGLVDLVDDGGQRGGLARAGRPGDQDEAPRLVTERVEHLGQTQVVDRLDLDGHHPEGRRQSSALEEGVHAKASHAVERVGEVHLPVGLELLALVLGEDAVDHLSGGDRVQRRVVESLEMAVDADHRRHAHR